MTDAASRIVLATCLLLSGTLNAQAPSDFAIPRKVIKTESHEELGCATGYTMKFLVDYQVGSGVTSRYLIVCVSDKLLAQLAKVKR